MEEEIGYDGKSRHAASGAVSRQQMAAQMTPSIGEMPERR